MALNGNVDVGRELEASRSCTKVNVGRAVFKRKGSIEEDIAVVMKVETEGGMGVKGGPDATSARLGYFQ